MFEQRVRRLLLALVRQGVLVVEAVVRWRETLWRPCAFMHNNVSYLQKMQTDADFLFTADGARLLGGLGIPSEEAALASVPVALMGNKPLQELPDAVGGGLLEGCVVTACSRPDVPVTTRS